MWLGISADDVFVVVCDSVGPLLLSTSGIPPLVELGARLVVPLELEVVPLEVVRLEEVRSFTSCAMV